MQDLFFKKKIATERLVNLYTEQKKDKDPQSSNLNKNEWAHCYNVFFSGLKPFSEHGYLYVTLSFCCNQTN